jgi:hypothetical protein
VLYSSAIFNEILSERMYFNYTAHLLQHWFAFFSIGHTLFEYLQSFCKARYLPKYVTHQKQHMHRAICDFFDTIHVGRQWTNSRLITISIQNFVRQN